MADPELTFFHVSSVVLIAVTWLQSSFVEKNFTTKVFCFLFVLKSFSYRNTVYCVFF